ncbi:hypothetical protein IKE99_01250 [Candidatus Saccharibacteria bacterium]|nr:hypothetical protein [Candidatus Saccharibacteria bacterium]
MYDNDFEKYPSGNAEVAGNSVPPEQDFDKSFETGVPEFAGNQFGTANESNRFYGETVSNDESAATRNIRDQFRTQYSMPKTEKRSRESFIKALADMKELISEVEGADPRYANLRQAARASEKGYFEYAVKDYGLRGLTDLFSVLSRQKAEKPNDAPEADSHAIVM